jgi:hypothetical protein
MATVTGDADWTADGTLTVGLSDPISGGAADWTADGTLTVGTPTGVAARARATWTAQSVGTASVLRDIVGPTADGSGGGKRVVIVDQTGDALGTLDQATNITTSHRLNEWDTYQFELPADDPKIGLLLGADLREAQVWWEDVILAWGPMTRPRVDDDKIVVAGVGAPWYLSRRHVGKASRDNELTNGSFENGLTGWNAQKTAFFLDYEAVPVDEVSVGDSVNAKDGTQVLQLDATMTESPAGYSSVWGDVFVWQEIVVAGGERGMDVTLVAWAWVDTIIEAFDDWEPHRFGPLLARMGTDWRVDNAWVIFGQNTWGGTRAFYTDVYEVRSAYIDDRTPTDKWVRLETTITVPPGTTQSVICRLSGLSGSIYYDRATVTLNSAFERFQVDQAEIVCDLVAHAQDPAFDKNDVNLDCDNATTDVLRDLVALHSQHGNIWSLIRQFTDLQDGIDLGVAYTPTSRTLTTHWPQKGTYRRGLALTTGRNVSEWLWSFDGEAATSSMVLLGTGSGSDREEASAIDDTRFPDGLILETIETVDADTPVEQLDALAAEALEVLGDPEVLEVTTFPNDPDRPELNFIGRLQEGDWLPVSLRKGRLDDGSWAWSIENDYRVIAITILANCALRLTLNRRDIP